MAIVPVFQGGVIQDIDNGRAPTSEARFSQPTFDYEKNFDLAIKPIQEAGKSMTKAAEIMAARNVKAEADDAETQYLDLERRIFYGPSEGEEAGIPVDGADDIPNGYFATQGKNSVDTFQKSLEGLKKGSEDILKNLSPWARESLQSRLNDRLSAAQTKMLQWRNSQEQAWHLGSSEKRIDSLIRSAGDNPNDKNYLAKTKASINQEVDYIARLKGWDSTQTSEVRKKYNDLAEASRYSAWSQDNPLAALQDFQEKKDAISADVRQKLSGELFRAASPMLGVMLSDQYGGQILEKKDFIREMMKGTTKTGIPVIDNLTTTQKMQLWQSAHAVSAQRRTSAQNELSKLTKNALSETSMYGTAQTVPTEDQFVTAFGEDKGKEHHAQFVKEFETTTAIHNYAGMTDAEIQADVEAAKPIPGSPDFKEQKDLYDARIKAAKELSKVRRQDSVGFACAGGQYGFEPLNLGNTDQLVSQLRLRVEKSKDLSRAFGSPEKVFSKKELEGITAALDAAPIDNRIGLLATMADALGPAGLKIASSQFKESNQVYAIAMAGFDISNDGYMSAGEKYLRGVDAIETKRVKLDERAEYGLTALISTAFGDDPSRSVRGLFDNPQAADVAQKMARGIYAYNSIAGLSTSVFDCVNSAVGGSVEAFNHRKIVLPRGISDISSMTSRSFNNLIKEHQKTIRAKPNEFFVYGGNAITADGFSIAIGRADLKTESVNSDGSVTYSVEIGGSPVYTSTGKLYTFSLRK